MRGSKVEQNKNHVSGDLINGSKITNNVYIQKEIAKATEPLRSTLSFEPEKDSVHTVLLNKLEEGRVNSTVRSHAMQKKVRTIPLLLKLCKRESGQGIVEDLYENLLSVINGKYLMLMDEGDLLKFHMKEIHEEFTPLVKKYEDLIPLDESLIEGLLYIATSNCAIKWKVDEVS